MRIVVSHNFEKAFSEHVDLHTGFYFLHKNSWIDISADVIEKIVDEVGFIQAVVDQNIP